MDAAPSENLDGPLTCVEGSLEVGDFRLVLGVDVRFDCDGVFGDGVVVGNLHVLAPFYKGE